MEQSNTILKELRAAFEAGRENSTWSHFKYKNFDDYIKQKPIQEIPLQQNQEVTEEMILAEIGFYPYDHYRAKEISERILSKFIQPLQSELQKARGINENLIAANKLQTKELLQAASELQRLKEESFFNKFQEQLSNVQELMWENAKQKEEIDRLKKEVEENNQVIDHLTQQVIGKL
jgi:predicted RNase H-like nuclease (RuvC/YqgF family)